MLCSIKDITFATGEVVSLTFINLPPNDRNLNNARRFCSRIFPPPAANRFPLKRGKLLHQVPIVLISLSHWEDFTCCCPTLDLLK
ncbi:hypothetical protein PR048_002505, partial [Dryococelus australis]